MEAMISTNLRGCGTFSANAFNACNTCHGEYCKGQGTTACGDCDNARAASMHEYSTTISIPTSMSSMLKLGRERRSQWRAHHEEFKVIMRRLRGVHTERKLTASESWTERSNPSLQRCSHCSRTFSEAAFSKHIDRCRETCSDISRNTGVNHEKAEAMERFRSRMRCKPKLLVNERGPTVSSSAAGSSADYTDTGCLSCTSSAPLNSRLLDSSLSESTAPFTESSVCLKTDRSSWDCAGQSSNCNHVQTPQKKRSDPKVGGECSSFLSANTEKAYLDNLKDVNFNSQASVQQQHPLCDTPNLLGCSSPSTASSLSTVSLLPSGYTHEISPVSAERSNNQPSHRKKFHCPWSPTTSSFVNPTNTSIQGCVFVHSAFSKLGTPRNTGHHSGTPTNAAPVGSTSTLSTEQSNIECTATASNVQRPHRTEISVNRGCGSANSSVQCNLKPNYSRRRAMCKHMHKSCPRSHGPSKADMKQANCAVQRPRPFDSASCVQSARLVEGDTHEWLLHHPLSAITKMEEAQLIRHSRTSETALQSSAKESTEMDWSAAQVGKSGDLTPSKNLRDDGVCLVLESALCSRPLSRANPEPANTNTPPIILTEVEQTGSQCQRHSKMTELKGLSHTSKVLQTYLPGYPTALALTKAMLHHHRPERQVEHNNKEYQLTVELHESDVDDVNVKPENTLPHPRVMSQSLPAVYCHECGARYATDCAKYCSGCGTSRPLPCVPVPQAKPIHLDETISKGPALQVERFLGRFAQLAAEACPFQ